MWFIVQPEQEHVGALDVGLPSAEESGCWDWCIFLELRSQFLGRAPYIQQFGPPD